MPHPSPPTSCQLKSHILPHAFVPVAFPCASIYILFFQLTHPLDSRPHQADEFHVRLAPGTIAPYKRLSKHANQTWRDSDDDDCRMKNVRKTFRPGPAPTEPG